MSENLFLFSPSRENNSTLLNNNIHILEDALEHTGVWEIGSILDYDIGSFILDPARRKKNIIYFNTGICTLTQTGDIAFNDAIGTDLNRISQYFSSFMPETERYGNGILNLLFIIFVNGEVKPFQSRIEEIRTESLNFSDIRFVLIPLDTDKEKDGSEKLEIPNFINDFSDLLAIRAQHKYFDYFWYIIEIMNSFQESVLFPSKGENLITGINAESGLKGPESDAETELFDPQMDSEDDDWEVEEEEEEEEGSDDYDLPDDEMETGIVLTEPLLDLEIRHNCLYLEDLQRVSRKGGYYTVWYGTNRQPNDAADITRGFGTLRDHQVNYGVCQVYIPKAHRIGETTVSLWQRLLGRESMRIEGLTGLSETAYWQTLNEKISGLPFSEKTATIFVHGYNVSFEGAALQTAQIGYDLNLPGVFAFYSWPSKANLQSYNADEATIQASEDYLAHFISGFVNQSGAENVNIIAHSMGNRGILHGFDRILNNVFRQTGKKIHQLVLAAPDVDKDVFNNLSGVYALTSDRTTMYVSKKDRALWASGAMHQFPRAGYVPPISVCKGIDTVDVGSIDLSLLGHGYVSSNRIILTDMHDLMMNDTEPDRRMGLRSVRDASNNAYHELIK